MNVFFALKAELLQIVQNLASKINVSLPLIEVNSFSVEPSKDKNHGDIASNLALVFAKNFALKPQELAKLIIADLADNPKIQKAQIAGAGFINLTLCVQVWQQFLVSVLQNKEFILPQLGDKNQLINLEYASPNPTGPMHIGHCRGAIYGDVLANLLEKTGHKITREYYVNNAGGQIITLVKSAYLRYLEALGQEIIITDGLYPGEYLKPVGQALKEKFGNSLENKALEQYLPLIRHFVVAEMMKIISVDLAELGIKHDTFFFEKENLHDTGKIDQAIAILQKQGLIYQGRVEAPKDQGRIIDEEEFSNEQQTIFASTQFGDDCDRVVRKLDGTLTYLAGDIAYLLSKFERGATKMILPLGFDHAGYVKRLSAACQAITQGKANVKVILCQMVKFVKNGEQLKMSKRAGNFITLKEVLDEVGAEALRFTMMTRKNDAPFDFDLAKVVEANKDNPIFYVQYAFARSCSVLRNLQEQMPNLDINLIDPEVLKYLSDESEIELVKKLASYPRIIEMAVANYEPHRLAFYLQELAAIFHSLWNKGNDNPNLKFIIKDQPQLTKARVYMLLAMQKIISSGLAIFNIKPKKEMR